MENANEYRTNVDMDEKFDMEDEILIDDDIKIMNGSTIFNFCESEIRTVIQNGEPWFVAKGVCDVLGTATRDIKKILDDDEVDIIHTTDTTGREQEMIIVNESGLYSLVLRSRKPVAKPFKRWVTHEVIPSIRKTGGYVANEDIFVETYLPFSDEITRSLFRSTLKTVQEQNQLLQKQQTTIVALEPKGEAFDCFLDTDNTLRFTDVGKSLGVSAKKLCRFLREEGIIFGEMNTPLQRYLDKGHFKVVFRKDRYGNNVPQTRVTALGVEFIRQLLKQNDVVA